MKTKTVNKLYKIVKEKSGMVIRDRCIDIYRRYSLKGRNNEDIEGAEKVKRVG